MKIVNFTQNIEYLAAKIKPFYWIFSLYYRSVIRREVSLADLRENDRVLCIGGGNCPFSAILLHRFTGAKITVIDNCEHCVKQARKVINALGLNAHISVLRSDGNCPKLSLDEYSAIHFAMQVNPMEEVLESVEKNAAPGTKILVRKPREALCKMYSVCNKNFDRCRQTAHAKTCNIGSTLLYVKRGLAA